jgi:hypothetical protein
MRLQKMNYCLNQYSQDYRMSKMSRTRRTEKESPSDFNMYNPLQAKRSSGYKIATTLSELRSSSICYHGNHLNHINHSSDKKGRMGEGRKGRKVQATSIFSWLACLLLVACCLLPYNNVIKSNL